MRQPKLEIPINIPTTIVLKKQFKSGTGQYGNWYGWNVDHEGVEKTVFADDGLQNYLATSQIGVPLVVIKGQIPGSKSFRWTVQPPMATMPPPLAPTPVQPPVMAQNGHQARDTYRAERVGRAKQAFEDAEAVMSPEVWSREDVRALAISFLIDEERKGVAPPSDESPF